MAGYLPSMAGTEKSTRTAESLGEYHAQASKERYVLTPLHRFDVYKIDLDLIDECSDEWDKAIEVIDYKVALN